MQKGLISMEEKILITPKSFRNYRHKAYPAKKRLPDHREQLRRDHVGRKEKVAGMAVGM